MDGGMGKLPPYICAGPCCNWPCCGTISNGMPENSCGPKLMGVAPGYMDAGDGIALLDGWGIAYGEYMEPSTAVRYPAM